MFANRRVSSGWLRPLSLFTGSGHSSRVGRSGAARGVPGNVHDVRLRVAGGRSPLGRALRPSRARMYNSAVRCSGWAGRVLTTWPFSVYFGGGALLRVGVRAVHQGGRHSMLAAAIGVGSSDSPNPPERQSSAGGWGPSGPHTLQRVAVVTGSAWEGRRAGGGPRGTSSPLACGSGGSFWGSSGSGEHLPSA